VVSLLTFIVVIIIIIIVTIIIRPETKIISWKQEFLYTIE
jgi:hypothetical protein